MTFTRTLLAFFVLTVWASEAHAQQRTYTYSKAVQKACADDYKRHCGSMGLKLKRSASAWTVLGKD